MGEQAPIMLASVLAANAAARPDMPAVADERRAITFADLAARAASIAGGFARRGLKRQDRVAILSHNRVEFCELYAACEIGGFIAVTVNYRLANAEVAHILRDSGARAIVFEADYAALVAEMRGTIDGLELFIAMDDPADWSVPLSAIDAAGGPQAGCDDIAYLIYTSGTTGRPKGCMIGQRPEAEKARITAGDIRMSAADTILLTMPLFHIGAKAMLNAQHWVGGRAILHREFRPGAVLEAVERERITILHLAPTMVQMLLEHPEVDSRELSSLRAIVYSASAMPLAVLRRGIERFGSIFYQIYGLTEGIGTILVPEHHRVDGTEAELKRLRSIGQPSPGVALRIAGDDERPMPEGNAGEVWLRTPTATCGYWNNHGASIEALRDGWLRTGDIGYRDRDGFIYLVDRKKDMIVSGGENIYSREVEDALYEHAAVKEAAVIGVPDRKWGEAVRAVVVLRDGAAASAGNLIDHVRTLLASYKKPRDVVFIAALPKTANGKIDKQAIRAAYGSASPIE